MKVHPQPPIQGVCMIKEHDKNVKLQITIGKASEEGVTAVSLGGKDLGSHSNNFSLDLGKANDIDGLLLHTTTTILDLSEEHNDLLHKVKLSVSGRTCFYEKREKTVPDHGDGVSILSFIMIITI